MPPGGPATGALPRPLEQLLRDLGPRLRRGEAPRELPERWPTGIASVDALLGGGFPQGRLIEISGPVSSGRTSLVLALLATVTRADHHAAVVDASDSFDPESAEAAGVDLERVLWARAPGLREALRSAELLLEAGGFALVLLDFARRSPAGDAAERSHRTPPPVAWRRLARAAARGRSTLVAVGPERVAGPAAELALVLQPARARFRGTPALLEGLDGEILVARNRAGPSDGSAPFVLHLPPLPDAT